ncbi:MAG: PhzF family phenazine biosynthesis protein [Bradyrhizobium sp.]
MLRAAEIPAGVVICEAFPEVPAMQALAAEIGYSETVFAVPEDGDWRVRYFAPAMEVPFCGHATVALGAILAKRRGNGSFSVETQQRRPGLGRGGTYPALLRPRRCYRHRLQAGQLLEPIWIGRWLCSDGTMTIWIREFRRRLSARAQTTCCWP